MRMAWRPSGYLIEGELDNTKRGKVTGWMRFVGLSRKVTFDLKGDFHRDIRGTRIRFKGDGDESDAAAYMKGLAEHQRGDVGDMTAGLPPRDYADYPYLEWYGDENGRVVLELRPDQVEILGRLRPYVSEELVPRTKQQENMAKFLTDISRAVKGTAMAVSADGKKMSDVRRSGRSR
jgi:hypothetical protein